MAHEVLVTSEVFAKVKNAYTGKPMRVLMVVTGKGEPLFHADKSEYSTSDHFETKRQAYDAWNRKDGISGLKNNKPITCAYTGEPLGLVDLPDGFYYSGGFNPKMLYPRDEFLYRATMRGGVSQFPKPGSAQRVDKVARVDMPEKRKNKDRGGDVSGEAVDLAAASMQKHKDAFDKKTVVHVSKGGRK